MACMIGHGDAAVFDVRDEPCEGETIAREGVARPPPDIPMATC